MSRSEESYSSSESDSSSDSDEFRTRVARADDSSTSSSESSDSESDSDNTDSGDEGSAPSNKLLASSPSPAKKSNEFNWKELSLAEIIEMEGFDTIIKTPSERGQIMPPAQPFDPYQQNAPEMLTHLFEDEAARTQGSTQRVFIQRTKLMRRSALKAPVRVPNNGEGAGSADDSDSEWDAASIRSPEAAAATDAKKKLSLSNNATKAAADGSSFKAAGFEKLEGVGGGPGQDKDGSEEEEAKEGDEEADFASDADADAPPSVEPKKGLVSVGVSLVVLKDLRSLLASVFKGDYKHHPTIKDLVQLVIRPMTGLQKGSLLQFMAGDKAVLPQLGFRVPRRFFRKQKLLYGKATVYVSHAWDYSLDELISTLESYEEDEMKNAAAVSGIWESKCRSFFWLDFACMNQWKLLCGPQKCPSMSWFRETLPNFIKAIGSFCLVILPWDSPLALSRTWCLYELAACYLVNVDISLRFCRERHPMFMSMIPDYYEECFAAVSKFHVSTDDSSAASFLARGNMLEIIDEAHLLAKGRDTRSPPLNANVFLKRLLHRWLDREAVALLLVAEKNKRAAAIKLHDEQFTHYRHGIRRSIFCNAFGCAEVFDESETVKKLQLEVLGIMQNTARLYVQLGDLPSAERKYEECLREAEVRCGTLHVSTLTLQGNIALVRKQMGKVAEAEELMKLALARKETELGESHPSTVASLTNLGTLLKEAGKFEQARRIFSQVLRIQEAVLGDSDDITLTTVEELAGILLRLNLIDATMSLLKRLLLARTQKLGKTHRETLIVLETIGDLYIKQCDWKSACTVYSKVLPLREQTLGEIDPITLNCYNRLGKIHTKLEDYNAAEEFYKKLLVGTTETLGPSHFGAFSTRDKLISLDAKKAKLGLVSQAVVVERCNALLEETSATLSWKDPVTCTVAHHLAEALFEVKRYREALDLFRLTFTHRKAIFGDTNPYSLLSMHGLALTLAYLRQFRESYDLFTQLIAYWDAHPDFGPMSDKTIQSVVSYIDVCFIGGDDINAENGLCRLLSAYQKTLGANHAKTIAVVEKLKRLHLK